MKEKKITSKKLENGDTFATRIEDKDSKYYGRYLIFICFMDELWLNYWSKNDYCERDSPHFRIKITTKFEIPKSKKEIDELEYIISKATFIEQAYFPLLDSMSYTELVESRSFQQLCPDEYGYLNEYLNMLYPLPNNSMPEFTYLGNFDIEPPKDEYISFGCDMHFSFFHKIIDETINHYEWYNKRESDKYIPEKNKKYHEIVKKRSEFYIETEDYYRTLNDKEKKNFQPKFISGWGPGLYDSYVAQDVKEIYLELFNDNSSISEIMNLLLPEVRDFIDDQYDAPTAWMVLADLQMNNKRLDEKLKNLALDSIEIDLSYWKGNEQYEERRKELDKLKQRLDSYKL